jgi:integrase
MNRRNPSTPTYRLHRASGQATVKLSGTTYYLGKHDSPHSRKKYDELIARWLAGGRELPGQRDKEVSVAEIVLTYIRYIEQYFSARRQFASNLWRVKRALGPVTRMYGLTQAVSFGPKALKTVRNALIAEELSRQTVNERVQTVKRMFRWATGEELLPASCWHALQAVEGLRTGDSPALEPKKVMPVRDEVVNATLPHVLPPVRAMVELQRLTGMRSGEVVIMRGCDLNMSGELWAYRLAVHKTDRHGHVRDVMLGKAAQEIIRPFLRTNLEEYLFRPDEALAKRRAERSAKRRTKRWPSHLRRNRAKRKLLPRRTPRERYSTASYARAITRACEIARVELWTPHQLRHSFATRVRKEFGIEAARIMLGHKHVAVTEIYAERDAAVAERVAKVMG